MRCETLNDLRDVLEKQGLEFADHDLEALWESLPQVRRICEQLGAMGRNEVSEHSDPFSLIIDNLTANGSFSTNTNDC